MSLNSFFDNYFLQPIRVEEGYNIFNTFAYAIILLGIIYGVYLLFKKLNLKIGLPVFLAFLPFIALGSLIRSFVDVGIVGRSFWTITPGVYLAVIGFFVAMYLISQLIARKINISGWKLCLAVGLGSLATCLAQNYGKLSVEKLGLGLGILVIVLAFVFAAFGLFKLLKQKWATYKLSFFAISAQLFDALNTAFILQFSGGVEKHVLPSWIISLTGSPFSFIPLKLFVVLPTVYLICKEVKDENWRNLLLIAIAALGLAQGLRNLITLIL